MAIRTGLRLGFRPTRYHEFTSAVYAAQQFTEMISKISSSILPDSGVIGTFQTLQLHVFQELALLHGTRRTATVSCKDAVELIAVDKEDFVQMNQLDSDEEKEHIKFVK